MKTVVLIVLATFVLLAPTYAGGPGTGNDRCLWPTNPSGHECFLDWPHSQPT
jgi:hypothetical protein